MKRENYLKVVKKNKPIVDIISKIKSNNPFLGYRRVWTHLCFIDEIKISKNSVYKLMKINLLLVKHNLKLKAKKSKLKSKPVPTKHEWCRINMTKVMIDGFGWVYLVIVINWYYKKIVGNYSAVASKSRSLARGFGYGC